MTELEAYKVGDIDDVVDGACTTGFDGATQPDRAFADMDVVDLNPHVTRAVVAIFDADKIRFCDGTEIGAFDVLHFDVEGGGEFTRHAVMAQAIAAVRRQTDFKDIRVIRSDGFRDTHRENVGDGDAQRGIVRETQEGIVVGA